MFYTEKRIISFYTVKRIVLISLVSSIGYADSFKIANREIICEYNLTIPSNNGTILYKSLELKGVLKYIVTKRYGIVEYGVDFTKSLIEIGQDNLHNSKFIDNVTETDCKEI